MATPQEIHEVAEKRDNLVSDLASSDFVKENILGESLDDAPDSEPKEEEKAVPEEEQEEKEEESSGEEAAKEEEDPQGEEEQEDDEEVIAKSKFDKRIASLTAQNRAKELEIERLKIEASKSKDPQMQKLEAMSEPDLKKLKRDTRLAQLQASKDDDNSLLSQYLELEDKIDDVLRTAGDRFGKEQVANYQKAVNDVLADPDLEITQDAEKQIMEDAKAIYQRSSSMQKSVTGQAEALLLAVERHKIDGAKKPVKREDKEAKRQINKLKKKTSLDGKMLKGDLAKDNLRKLRKAAKSGDDYDKMDYAIKSGMLGDVSKLVDTT